MDSGAQESNFFQWKFSPEDWSIAFRDSFNFSITKETFASLPAETFLFKEWGPGKLSDFNLTVKDKKRLYKWLRNQQERIINKFLSDLKNYNFNYYFMPKKSISQKEAQNRKLEYDIHDDDVVGIAHPHYKLQKNNREAKINAMSIAFLLGLDADASISAVKRAFIVPEAVTQTI